MNDLNACCENCFFYSMGYCKRYPPSFTISHDRFVYPEVEREDWCGEFHYKNIPRKELYID